jgi:hypothetical protein
VSDTTRHSSASEAEIITDLELRARVEGENGLRQFRTVTDMVESYLNPSGPFKFRPSHLLSLHRVALVGLSGLSDLHVGTKAHRPAGISRILRCKA